MNRSLKIARTMRSILKQNARYVRSLCSSSYRCKGTIYSNSIKYILNKRIDISAYRKGKPTGVSPGISNKLKRSIHSTYHKQIDVHEAIKGANSKYRMMTCQKLKAELRKRSLKVSGKKAELIHRLCQYDSNSHYSVAKPSKESEKSTKIKRNASNVSTIMRTPSPSNAKKLHNKSSKDVHTRHVSTTATANLKNDKHTTDLYKPAKKTNAPAHHVSIQGAFSRKSNNKKIHVKTSAAIKLSDKLKHSFKPVVTSKSHVGKDFTIIEKSHEGDVSEKCKNVPQNVQHISKGDVHAKTTLNESVACKEKSLERLSKRLKEGEIINLESSVENKFKTESANETSDPLEFGVRDILFWGTFSICSLLWFGGARKDGRND